MKLKILLSLLFIGAFLTVNSSIEGNLRKLVLLGELDPTGSRSIVIPSVTAEQSDDAVILTFSKAVGTINITISSESDIVYSTTLNVTSATQFPIYTDGFDPGTYFLNIIKPSTNGRLYAEIIVE